MAAYKFLLSPLSRRILFPTARARGAGAEVRRGGGGGRTPGPPPGRASPQAPRAASRPPAREAFAAAPTRAAVTLAGNVPRRDRARGRLPLRLDLCRGRAGRAAPRGLPALSSK